MPTYDYMCDNCGQELELQHSMFIDPVTECPSCLQNTLKRCVGIPRVYIKPSDDSCTLGLLADRNMERFSDDQKKHLANKHKTKQVFPENYELPKGAIGVTNR